MIKHGDKATIEIEGRTVEGMIYVDQYNNTFFLHNFYQYSGGEPNEYLWRDIYGYNYSWSLGGHIDYVNDLMENGEKHGVDWSSLIKINHKKTQYEGSKIKYNFLRG